jgi:hypothetical protein
MVCKKAGNARRARARKTDFPRLRAAAGKKGRIRMQKEKMALLCSGAFLPAMPLVIKRAPSI